jgi:hypothetical protein
MMSRAVTTSPGRREQFHGAVVTYAPHGVRHAGVLDRAALHLGVALIRWGRRPVKVDVHERAAAGPETDEALRTMEHVHDQSLAMSMNRFR